MHQVHEGNDAFLSDAVDEGCSRPFDMYPKALPLQRWCLKQTTKQRSRRAFGIHEFVIPF
jgi:hypothetical protein